MLSSDTKWDDLYMFIQTRGFRFVRGTYGDLGIPMFGDLHRNNCFVTFRYEYALLTFYTSGMILEGVIKQMVVNQKM